jgi:hypothetical protein
VICSNSVRGSFGRFRRKSSTAMASSFGGDEGLIPVNVGVNAGSNEIAAQL